MKSFFRTPKQGLRVLVLFHDTVVEDRVYACGESVRLGEGGDLEIPPPVDRPDVANLVWTSEQVVRLEDHRGQVRELSLGESAVIEEGPVSVTCSVLPQFRHPRPSLLGEGDVVLAVAILAMSVFAMQLEALFRLNQEPPASAMTMPDPTVDYIVRLLSDDLDGSADARTEAAGDTGNEGLDAKEVDSFFMPSGTITDLENLSGGAEEGLKNRIPEEPEHGSGEFQPLPDESGLEVLELLGEQADQSFRDVPDQSFDDQFLSENDEEDDAPLSPTEEALGWGFYDWYDARDARQDRDDIGEKLTEAQERLAIDPDNPWALTQLGYYQYLAFDYEGCKDTYARFISLYPSDAAGYNNLALVYKRLGEYPKEEAHYRLALALDPEDTFVLNNLAVNLAHQGRFGEALEIMAKLERIQPDDPYADLHRSKIAASMGEPERALGFLEDALLGMAKLDTLHHIEFRQDIRVDPSFDSLRLTEGFSAVLLRYYGEDALPLLAGEGGHGG